MVLVLFTNVAGSVKTEHNSTIDISKQLKDNG